MKFTVHIFTFLFLTFSQSFSAGAQQYDESGCCYWGIRAMGWVRDKIGPVSVSPPPFAGEHLSPIGRRPTPSVEDHQGEKIDDEKRNSFSEEKQSTSYNSAQSELEGLSEDVLKSMAFQAKYRIEEELGLMGETIFQKVDEGESSDLMTEWDDFIEEGVKNRSNNSEFLESLQLYCGTEIGKLLFDTVGMKLKLESKGRAYTTLSIVHSYRKNLLKKANIYQGLIDNYIAIKKELEGRHRSRSELEGGVSSNKKETLC